MKHSCWWENDPLSQRIPRKLAITTCSKIESGRVLLKFYGMKHKGDSNTEARWERWHGPVLPRPRAHSDAIPVVLRLFVATSTTTTSFPVFSLLDLARRSHRAIKEHPWHSTTFINTSLGCLRGRTSSTSEFSRHYLMHSDGCRPAKW